MRTEVKGGRRRPLFLRKSFALDFGSPSGGSASVKRQFRPDTLPKGFLPVNAPATPSLHRFDAYCLAVDFRRYVVAWLPLKRAELSDQLDRASISVALNIAEGAGQSLPRERARHYTVARGSAVECLACLDLLELETTVAAMAEARAIILRLLNVLTALIRK